MTNSNLPVKILLPTTGEPPDRLGISAVNGFYGPGSWAGWFLAIMTSWITILRDDGSGDASTSHSIVMHILYSNWAAIDLFRQLSEWRTASEGLGDRKEAMEKLAGPIAAALIISFWGLVTMVSQLLLCTMVSRQNSFLKIMEEGVPLTKQTLILLIGMLIPSIALFDTQCALPNIVDSWNGNDFGLAEYLPGLFVNMREGTEMHAVRLMGACAFGLSVLLFLCFLSVDVITQFVASIKDRTGRHKTKESQYSFATLMTVSLVVSFSIIFYLAGGFRPLVYRMSFMWGAFDLAIIFAAAGDRTSRNGWLAVLCVIMGFPFIGLPFLLTAACQIIIVPATFGSWIVTSFKGAESCLFRPCAPQKISEWDQAFGLIGLVMFAAEVWPAVWWVVRGLWQSWKTRNSL